MEFSFSYLFVWNVSLWTFIFFPLQMSLCQTSGHHLKLSWAHPSQVKTSRIMLPGRRRGQGFQMCGNIIIQLVILNAVVNMVRSHEGGYPWKTRLLVKGNKSWTNLEVIIRNGVWSNNHLPLLRTSAQVVKKSISVFNNSLFLDCSHLDYQMMRVLFSHVFKFSMHLFKCRLFVRNLPFTWNCFYFLGEISCVLRTLRGTGSFTITYLGDIKKQSQTTTTTKWKTDKNKHSHKRTNRERFDNLFGNSSMEPFNALCQILYQQGKFSQDDWICPM